MIADEVPYNDFANIFDNIIVGEFDSDDKCANCDQHMGIYVGHCGR